MVSKLAPWKAIYKSWYSPEIYREAAHVWRGLGYKYLVGVLVALWALAAIHVHVLFNDLVEGFLKPVLKEMPVMEIKDGFMTIDQPYQFHEVKDPRSGKVLVTFDLSAHPADPALDKDGIFLQAKRVIFHYDGKERVYDFTQVKETTYTWRYYIDGLEVVRNWLGVVVLGAFWLFSFLTCAIQVLIYGLVGKVFAVFNKCRLTYPQLVRISAVAITPSLIIDTCQKLICTGLPAWTAVSVVVSLFFLLFGVRANSIGYAWKLANTASGVQLEPKTQSHK